VPTRSARIDAHDGVEAREDHEASTTWSTNTTHAPTTLPFCFPVNIVVNGATRSFDPPPADVAGLVRALDLEGKRIAVERNGEVVPRSRWADTPVLSTDRLEIIGAVGGG
jgi:sulfur carrier protein